MIWQRLSPPRGGRTSKLLLIFQYALQIRSVDRLKCTGLLSKDRQRYSFRNFRRKNHYYRKQYREQVVQQRVGERVVEQRNFVEKSLPFPFLAQIFLRPLAFRRLDYRRNNPRQVGDKLRRYWLSRHLPEH